MVPAAAIGGTYFWLNRSMQQRGWFRNWKTWKRRIVMIGGSGLASYMIMGLFEYTCFLFNVSSPIVVHAYWTQREIQQLRSQLKTAQTRGISAPHTHMPPPTPSPLLIPPRINPRTSNSSSSSPSSPSSPLESNYDYLSSLPSSTTNPKKLPPQTQSYDENDMEDVDVDVDTDFE
jgi:hypothetical protein